MVGSGDGSEGVRGCPDAIFLDYSPTSTIAGLQKPYLLVGLFTHKSYIFILHFLTKQISWPLHPPQR